jgi:hypothetical protein
MSDKPNPKKAAWTMASQKSPLTPHAKKGPKVANPIAYAIEEFCITFGRT